MNGAFYVRILVFVISSKEMWSMKRYECLLFNRCDRNVWSTLYSVSLLIIQFKIWSNYVLDSILLSWLLEVRFGGQPSMDYFLWEFSRGLYCSHGDHLIASKNFKFQNDIFAIQGHFTLWQPTTGPNQISLYISGLSVI